MTDQLDCVVIGAGVVGLAIGRSLALAGRDVVVLEAEPEIGMHTSSRNSEVIHAGIYYEQNSLKATLCVRGKEMLYDYCETRHVPFQRLGKLIVASKESEKERLLGIREKAENNGVTDLRLVERDEIGQLEPAVAGELALFSPSTGIIDSHSLMVSLQADIEAGDGVVLTHSKLERVEVLSSGFRLHVADIDEAFECKTLINSAGLNAEEVARSIEGLKPDKVCAVRYVIGHYFAYQGKSPFSHLVYPLPIDGGLESMQPTTWVVPRALALMSSGLITLTTGSTKAASNSLPMQFADSFRIWISRSSHQRTPGFAPNSPDRARRLGISRSRARRPTVSIGW